MGMSFVGFELDINASIAGGPAILGFQTTKIRICGHSAFSELTLHAKLQSQKKAARLGSTYGTGLAIRSSALRGAQIQNRSCLSLSSACRPLGKHFLAASPGSGGLLCEWSPALAWLQLRILLLQRAYGSAVWLRHGGPQRRPWPLCGRMTRLSGFRQLNGHLLCWPDAKLVGVASLKALGMNVRVIKHALEIWGQNLDFPKGMSIDYLKVEARLYTCMPHYYTRRHMHSSSSYMLSCLHAVLQCAGCSPASHAERRSEHEVGWHLRRFLGSEAVMYFGHQEMEVFHCEAERC